MSCKYFLETVSGKTYLHIPGTRQRFADLLPWSALNEILRHHQLDAPRLRLVMEDKLLPVDSYIRYKRHNALPSIPYVLATEMANHLSEGATLVIDQIDTIYQPITALVERLEQSFEVSIQANMYASWRSVPGFNVHWDDHDVIVLQIAGRKRWKIFGETEKYPVERIRQSQPPQGEPMWDYVLEDGDALYIPRGWWHSATACSGPTIHITLAIKNPTALDVLGWLAIQLRRREFMRSDVPRFADSAEKAKYIDAI